MNHNITLLKQMMVNNFLECNNFAIQATISCRNEIISKRLLIGKEKTLEEAK